MFVYGVLSSSPFVLNQQARMVHTYPNHTALVVIVANVEYKPYSCVMMSAEKKE